MENDQAARLKKATEAEGAVASGKLDLDGRLVLSDGGDSLGVVLDVVFDEGTGRRRGLATGDVEHDADRLRAIGPYCVIVTAGLRRPQPRL